jgi:hypothetical protein
MRRPVLVGALLLPVAISLALLVPGGGSARGADQVELDVKALAKDGRVLVSFTLVNGFTGELQEAIRSGLVATIAYDIELRRGGTLWFDRTVATAAVTATVRYDNLTRQHQLSRTVDGRGEEPRLTEDESQVREWLTVFKQVPLFSTRPLETNAEYYVRVRARTRPRVNWFLFWPWEPGVPAGQARFTLIQ